MLPLPTLVCVGRVTLGFGLVFFVFVGWNFGLVCTISGGGRRRQRRRQQQGKIFRSILWRARMDSFFLHNSTYDRQITP